MKLLFFRNTISIFSLLLILLATSCQPKQKPVTADEAKIFAQKLETELKEMVFKNSLGRYLYRSKPAYTRSVMAMAGMKFKDEAELRELGKNLTLLAVKPEKE